MTTSRPARGLLLALSILLAACGSPPPEAPPPDPNAGSERASPWDGMSHERLAALVREQARARIREVEPSVDVAQIPAWVADPETAPELGDRVSEQLLNLAIAAAATGANDEAAGLVRLVRAKARNRNNAYTGVTLLSELARRGAEADPAEPIRAVFAELPRNRFGGATVVFRLFQNPEQIDARVEQVHGQMLSLDTATAALFYDAILRPVVAHRDTFLTAIDAVTASHAEVPEAEPYSFSTVDLTQDRRAQQVVVAVWDTGVASSLFEAQLFTNEAEQPNGQDDDQNGLVDDLHGVVADPTEGQTGLTFEPGEETVTEYAPFLRGIMDLRAGLASTPAAQRVLELMAGARDREALERLETNLDAIGEWGHGTHVAGIMLAGVPQARVAVFRSAWAGEARLYRHRGPTDEELAAERQNIEEIARFINAHDVRVVNASLGFEQNYVEAALRHEGDRYASDAEVRARAEEVHRHRRENWRYVFEQCPDTLFVVAAGNSNRDVVEYGDVPSSLELPNLLVVGAVDRFGDWATFTNSNPEQVTVFDHGVEVDSVIPNAERVPLSGTSMASPNVANLATKMLAVNRALTPAQVIAIIEETGDPIAAPFYGRIANEQRAIARARRGR